MSKFYKVIKDTPLWEVGAILENTACEGKGYDPIEDIWNKHKKQTEYLSDYIVEDSPDFFQRVYKSKLAKTMFVTKEELKKLYAKMKLEK